MCLIIQSGYTLAVCCGEGGGGAGECEPDFVLVLLQMPRRSPCSRRAGSGAAVAWGRRAGVGSALLLSCYIGSAGPLDFFFFPTQVYKLVRSD